MLALHASAGVDGDRRRRVFSVRFLGDDMRHAPRAWVTSPEFPGLAERLPAGRADGRPAVPGVVDGAELGRPDDRASRAACALSTGR